MSVLHLDLEQLPSTHPETVLDLLRFGEDVEKVADFVTLSPVLIGHVGLWSLCLVQLLVVPQLL